MIKIEHGYNSINKVYALSELVSSGKDAFIDSEMNVYIIGNDCIYSVCGRMPYSNQDNKFFVQYFCDITICTESVPL